MDIHTYDHGPVAVLELAGRLDGSQAAAVEGAFSRLAGPERKQIVFDLAGLQYISSAGLRVILSAAKKLRSMQGRMICASLNEQVRDIFEMSGFLTILETADSREDAIVRLGGQI